MRLASVRSLAALSVPFFALAACAADSEGEFEDIDTAEDAISSIVTPRPDGRFDVACRTAAGVTWSRIVSESERSAGGLCTGVPYELASTWLGQRSGFTFVYDKPEIEVARFMVSRDATYRLVVPAHREWLGDATHPEAARSAKLAIFVDGACAGTFDVSSTSASSLESPAVRVRLAPGAHSVGIAIANDYWDESRGLDRNLWALPLRIARTSGKPTAAPAADACAIRGEYPGPAEPPPPPPAASPFDDGACTGAQLSDAEIIAKIPAGSLETAFGSISVFTRSRSCTGATGCGPWSAVTEAQNPVGGGAMNAKVKLRAYTQQLQYGGKRYRGQAELAFDGKCMGATTCNTQYNGDGAMSCGGFSPRATTGGYWRADGSWVSTCESRGGASATMVMTASCMKLTASSRVGSGDAWTEIAYAGVARY